jgi:hypothetical protein
MKVSHMVRLTALTTAVIFVLAGCGGAGTTVPQGAMTQSRAHRASGSYGDLLYVVCCSGSANEITMLTYPQGQVVGTIENGVENPFGICADASGNVWVVNVTKVATEYAHDGTAPIASLQVPNSWLAGDCAVDPSTGNLAIINSGGPSGFSIDVWPDAQGNPTIYPTDFYPWSCSYDDKGNLFVDGDNTSNNFVLAELPKASSTFTNLTLDKPWAILGRYDGMASTSPLVLAGRGSGKESIA